jgi:hypothetical protein
MAKKKAKPTRKLKVQVRDLKPRKSVRGGMISTRLGIRRPLVISAT